MKQVLMGFLFLGLTTTAGAQPIVSIVTEVVSKVVRAVDLEVQRMQTQTILVQEAQKELENAMSALRLDEIQGWVEQQKEIYADYFQELSQVKEVVSGYHRVSETIEREEQILAECRHMPALLGANGHFSVSELGMIVNVYGGILSQSERNLEQLLKAIQPSAFQMTDRERLALIDGAANNMDQTYRDLQVYTQENELIALQRASDENDYLTLKKLYGL